MPPTVFGRAVGLFFRNSAVYAVVSYRSGAKDRWRAVAPNIAAGFPVNPFPRDIADAAALWTRPGEAGPRDLNSL